jgi:hypothetical protein|tara:strand:- start:445 stop:1110 length:666 start_codon:yes stop_codon:yes gene_type:complete
MARLFITPREQDLISDLTKEIVKDVIGQKIYYYRVMSEVTKVHDIYEEAIEKHFDTPIELDATVEWGDQTTSTNRFGSEQLYGITAFVHYRDIIDKDIEVNEGDYFSYGETFFEITSTVYLSEIYGEIEYKTGIQLNGRQARKGLIDKDPIGPTDEGNGDADALQETFVQQRGQAENELGETGDIRALQKQGKLEAPLDGPKQVSPKGDPDDVSSSFYGDE